MRVRIETPVGSHELDTRASWVAGAPGIPCHRCGVCCERWQPLLTSGDAARLAAHLGLSLDAFRAEYTTPYPFDDEQRLLRREEGRCVFLRFEAGPSGAAGGAGGGLAACAVHVARPLVCRDWAAGLDKKECVQGLERFAGAGGLIPLDDLYPDPADRAAFAAAVYP